MKPVRQTKAITDTETLNANAFGLKERQEFFKKKWRKEHISAIACVSVAWLVPGVVLKLQGTESYPIGTVEGILAVLFYGALNNRMMAYVEDHIYGGKWNEYKGRDSKDE